MTKAIWWSNNKYYYRKIDIPEGQEFDRITLPNYLEPKVLVNFLNEMDEKYKK